MGKTSGDQVRVMTGRAAKEGRAATGRVERRGAAIAAVFDGDRPLKKDSLEALLLAPKGKGGRVELDAVRTDETHGLSKKKAAKRLCEEQEKLDRLSTSSTPRAAAACSSCSRRWTRAARTGPSARCCAASTLRA
jgi:hypothetical protein